MSNLTTPFLDEDKRDSANILPAVQKLLQLAYSEDPDKQLEAVVGISKMIERNQPVNSSSFGPLCHTLSRLAASDQRAVVAYAARGIKLLVLDDALRPQANVAGIPSVLAAALREWEDDTPCVREVLGALQTLCYDKNTVMAVLDAGVLGPVLELLDSMDLELRILATATAANVLSFSDSLLLTNKECIDAFFDSMEDLLSTAKSGDGLIRNYGLAALANACAHPVLAGRAKEIGALDLLRIHLKHTVDFPSGRNQEAQTAFARLNGVRPGTGDLEEGGDAGHARLRFYRFKWGIKPSVNLRFSPRERGWAIVFSLFVWAVIAFVMLRSLAGAV